MTGPVAITLSACAKTFADGTRALRPLDLEIIAGERLAVLERACEAAGRGPEGSSSSTQVSLLPPP